MNLEEQILEERKEDRGLTGYNEKPIERWMKNPNFYFFNISSTVANTGKKGLKSLLDYSTKHLEVYLTTQLNTAIFSVRNESLLDNTTTHIIVNNSTKDFFSFLFFSFSFNLYLTTQLNIWRGDYVC